MANWWDTAPKADPFDAALSLEGLDPSRAALARSIYQQESGGGRNTRTSNAGAVGGMQIIPATFKRMADEGWDINDPVHNARAGLRYINRLYDLADGDPRLAAAGYYGGEGAIKKARAGQAVSDPRNPRAPNTLQYADQVVSRLGGAQQRRSAGLLEQAVNAIIPAAQAAEPDSWWQSAPVVEQGGDDWWKDAPLADAQAPQQPQAEATADQRILASAPGRVARGVKDVIDAGAQMVTHALPESLVNAVNAVPEYLNQLPVVGPVTEALGIRPATAASIDQDIRTSEQQYQAARQATGSDGIDFARMGGNIAATAPLFAGAPAAATSFGGRIAAGVAGGAGAGLLSPVVQGEYDEEKMRQAGLGAAFGGAGSLVGAGLGRLMAPRAASNPQVQALLNEGVDLTPGQVLGGTARTVEDKAISLPVLGDAIRSARTRGVETLNRAALNRAVKPLGAKVGNIGREGMQEVTRLIDDAYDDVLPKLTFKADAQFGRDLGKLQQMTKNLPDGGTQFESIVKSQVGSRLTPQGVADGRNFKQIESEIGRLARTYRSSATASERDLGMALGELQSSLRAALTRSNPNNAGQLRKINEAYANLTRLERAAGMVGADGGVFTPAQLSSAVRAGDSSMRKRTYSKGGALMQDLSDAGREVMNGTIPNSGTADRLLLNAAALGGAASVNPVAAAGLLGSSLPYLPGATRMMATAIARRPQGLLNAGGLLERYSPAAGLLGFAAQQ